MKAFLRRVCCRLAYLFDRWARRLGDRHVHSFARFQFERVRRLESDRDRLLCRLDAGDPLVRELEIYYAIHVAVSRDV